MRKRIKVAGVLLCALSLMLISIYGTLAYLTDRDEAANTFTVGDVDIRLDEADVNEDGTIVPDADRVQENTYHLLPGQEYTKDPTVTVIGGSDDCYVRMLVTITNSSEWDKIFDDHQFETADFIMGYKADVWEVKSNTEDTENNTRTYEFWYKEIVPASKTDTGLDPLFTGIKIPGVLTGREMATLKGFEIDIIAHAIQTGGFEGEPEKAWEAFGEQVKQ